MEWLNFVMNNPVFVALAETLLHFAWQGLLLASFLVFLLKSIHNRHSNLRYNLSLLVLLLCVVAPIVTFSVVYEPYTGAQSIDVKQAIASLSTSVSQVGTALGAWNDPNQVLWSITATEILDTVSHWQLETVSPFLTIVWMAGVVLMSTRLVVQLINVYQLPHQGTSTPDAPLQQTFERLMERLGVSMVARLLISSKVDVPMVIGWLKPVVLLPSAMVVGLTPKQLEMLLAHELAHVRRHDYLVNFLQTLVEVMLFFHPGVKWISRQIRTERECCCDDVAIALCGSPVAYASALTDAEMSRFTNIPQLAMAASGSDLKHRVFRAVGQADCSSGFNGHWISGMLAALSAVTIVFFMLSADVIGMTSHNDKVDRNDPFMVVVEPPVTVVQPVPAAKEVIQVAEAEPKVADAEIMVPMEDVKDFVETNYAPTSESDFAVGMSENDSLQISPAAEEQEESPSVVVTEKRLTTEDKQTISVETLVDRDMENSDASPSSDPAKPTEQIQVLQAKVPVEAPQQLDEIQTMAIQQPILLRSSTPDYPAQALKRKWSEEVFVKFVVNEEGLVEQVKFENDVHRVFRTSVKKALKKWQFEPALKDGKAIPMEVSKLFSFSDPVRNTITGSRIARL